MSERAVFIGGPLDGSRTELSALPGYVIVLGTRYERIDDPDTGEYLGCYAVLWEDR